MKQTNLYIQIFIGFLILSCQSQNKPNPIIDKIEIQLDSLLANSEFEAVSLGVVDGDRAYIFHKGSLLNSSTPNDETLYEIASITKTFTGTLLAQAIQENKVQLNDDIRKYLTQSLPNLEYADEPITFRHLVTHQSGLPHMFPDKKDLFNQPDWDKLPFIINELQKDFSKEDFFKELSNVKLDTLPGLNFAYSNCGTNLLGYLLENIYAKPFEELLQEKILNPLKMQDTKISTREIDLQKLAYGQNSNKIKMPVRAYKEMNAEGGIISSTKDLIKYLQFHLDESNEVIKISHQHLWNGKYGDFEAGFFWQIHKNGEKPDRIFQNGGAFGTSSWITLIPDSNIGIFIVTNVSGQSVHKRLSDTVEILIEEIEKNRL